ncbi:MAG: DUF1501 domain-containing protein [Alphaproteobacteria bacterium]|nr:DUF1501 domain-containing protein [Alphaproteobacteria bacterium]
MGTILSRRMSLGLLGGLVGVAGLPGLALASAATRKRFVLVILRGGMDGLSAAPPYGDPDYVTARAGLAIPGPGEAGGALKLDGTFGLAPELAYAHALYGAKELLLVHAAATPYRDRSHFDGQNLLENGTAKPYGASDGWVNRALAGLPPAATAGAKDLGVALASRMPLALTGSAPVTNWSPTVAPPPTDDTLARIGALYDEADPMLADAFRKAEAANAMAGGNRPDGDPYQSLARAAARFLLAEEGPRVAVLELGGWDTHARQLGAYSALGRNLATLDLGLKLLKEGLGPVWNETIVVALSEFGRTVAMNGSGGSDHGTGGIVLLAGGALAGGRVLADWPGLKPKDLYESRDLRTTTDARAVIKGILADHMGIAEAHLARTVFPDSADAKPVAGLVRPA